MLIAGKWGVAYEFEVPAIKRGVVDYGLSADWTPASGDSKISINGGNYANTTNLPAISGGTGAGTWKQTLTAAEMQSPTRVAVTWIDSATKVIEDQCIIIPIDYGVRSNTAQAGAASTITLDASASAVDDFYRGMIIEIIGGTGAGQMRRVASYVGSTKVATVNRSWATNPDNTSIFRLGNTAFGETDVTHLGGTAQTARDLGASVLLSSGTGTGQLDFTSGVVKSNLWQIMGSALTGTAAQVSAAFSTFFNVVTPSGTVNSIPDVLNVQGFSNDAITAASLDVSAVNEIKDGLATSANVTAVEGKVDTLLGRITSTLFSGITSLGRWLGAMAGKTADSTTQTEIRATVAGANYDITTDSQEAIRDRGDGSWVTGSAAPSAEDNATAVWSAVARSLTDKAGFTISGTITTLDNLKSGIDTTIGNLNDLSTSDITDALNGSVLVDSSYLNRIADHVRRRQQANVEASSDGDALSLSSDYGMIQQVQESAVSGGTWTIKRTDGTTTLGTRTAASDPGAEPITGVS